MMAVLAAAACAGANRVAAADLLVRTFTVGQSVSGSVIVGRAECLGSVWLLNEDHQLVRIVPASRDISVTRVGGLQGSDRPWGLACVDDELWTLADPRVLARVGIDGRVQERVTLQVPRIALFGAGDRLLFEQLPPVAGAAVLASSPPRKPRDVRPWPGLVARPAADVSRLLTSNLVSCGLSSDGAIPCWFPDETRITISDGARAGRHEFPFLAGSAGAPATPIRDVAVGSRGRIWLLATARERYRGRLVGGRLSLAALDGRERAGISLDTPARLILGATDTTCLLLTSRGDLLEVGPR